MPLLVVGSVAIDNVETPKARRDNLLGGSATHFSYAASFFTDVQLVGVVGEDWPPEHTELLNEFESLLLMAKALQHRLE